MSVMDKLSHKAEELKGKLKEHTGDATNNEDLKAEGEWEQTKGSFKQAGDHAKDAITR